MGRSETSEKSGSEGAMSSVPSCALAVAVASAFSQSKLLRPCCEPTTQSAKDESAVELLKMWNFPMNSAICCPFHCALMQLENCMQRLESQECVHTFGQEGGQQCKQCTIITADLQKCLCGKVTKAL